ANLSGKWTYGRAKKRRPGSGSSPIPLAIPEIIPPERDAALRHRLGTTARGEQSHRFYLLSNGMLTSECGGNYYGRHRSDRPLRQYLCANNRSGAECKCSCRRLHAHSVERVVWSAVADLLAQPERLIAMAQDYLGIRGEEM